MPKHKKEIDELRSRLRELEEENSQMRDELTKVREQLERSKLVGRAKGILMDRHRWTEKESFRRMQNYSMNNHISLIDLARRILNGDEINL